MKILVWGSGGREDALVRVLRRSGHSAWACPGNPGMKQRVAGDPIDVAFRLNVDLVVFGPEVPLTEGKADELRARGIPCFGPGAAGAMLEKSKIWMKGLVTTAGVPTADWRPFLPVQSAEAQRYAMDLIEASGREVCKTDGLAAGKGVLVTDDVEKAKFDIAHKLENGAIVIEEPLKGVEVSVFAITDGINSLCLPAAQDYKRQLDGDKGPNTGGMGAWSPLPFIEAYMLEHYPLETLSFEQVINRDFIQPTLVALQSLNINYRGVLYAGLMLTLDGPKLLEYNIRFGDPDSQVVLMRLAEDYDLGELLLAAALGDLTIAPPPRFRDETAVLVVAAAAGYPASPELGEPLDRDRIDRIARHDGVDIIYAGVDELDNGQLITSGGRVLDVLGYGPDAYTARKQVYGAMPHLAFPGMQYRSDIALPVGT
jgi:phosphoribosylamine--glycine ligase